MKHSGLRMQRRGMAIVMVLGLLAITFAVAFTSFRSQTNSIQLQTNGNLNTLAKQTAFTGFAVGLRKMHENAWAGIDTTFNGNAGSSQNYTITYTHGDPRLATDHAKQPFRVTMIVTARANDAARTTVSASASIRAILELVPKNTPTSPETFASALNHTLYQYAQDTCELQHPSQITGSVRLMGNLKVGDAYPPATNPQNRYLSDLNAMRTANSDLRPLQGPVSLPFSRTSQTIRDQVTNLLGVSLTDIPTGNASNWTYPGVVMTYKLYPGGKTYNSQSVGSLLQNTTLSPSNATNPAGIFYSFGNVQICDNTTINGTLICNRVIMCGEPSQISAVSLPSLDGTSTMVQLPAIISADDLEIQSGAHATVNGAVVLWDDLSVPSGSVGTSLNIRGRVLSKGVFFTARNEWNVSSASWTILYSAFLAQLTGQTPVPYFPTYLSNSGLNPAPVLTVKPEITPVRYVWKTTSNTVYTAASADPGLRWTVVDLNDNYVP